MNDNNLFSLGEIFGHLLKQYGLNDKMIEQKIENAWANIVGDYCNKCTSKIIYKNKNLFVYIGNAAVKQELNFVKTKIINELNETLGDNFVSNIKFR